MFYTTVIITIQNKKNIYNNDVPLRTSPCLASKPRRNYVYLKKLKKASQFSISDVIACVHSPPRFFTQHTYNNVCKHAKLRLLTRSPLITLRCSQYFALDQPTKRPQTSQALSQNNRRLGTYLYAILLMITGERWRKHGMYGFPQLENRHVSSDRCWGKLKRTLRCP